MKKEDIINGINACMVEGSAERCANAILREFSVTDLPDVLEHLVSVYLRAPDLLANFWQRTSDACPLECSAAENEERAFKIFVYNILTPAPHGA